MVKLSDTELRARRCAGAAENWFSSPGCLYCGAFQRSMVNLSRMEDVARPLCRSRPIPSGLGLLRREPGPRWRGAPPCPTGQLNVRFEYRRNCTSSLRLHRRASALAHGQSHRTAGGRRLRPQSCANSSMSIIPMPLQSVVQDNLSTHSVGSLYAALRTLRAPPNSAPLEFHYLPTRSWLNMDRDEIGVLRGSAWTAIAYPNGSARNRRLGRQRKRLGVARINGFHNRKGPRQNGPRLSRHSQKS